MRATASVDRFALFGEREQALAPEFVHIEAISQRSRLYNWTITPHAHPGIFQILMLETGSGVLATEGHEQALAPGTLVVLPSGCVHAFRFAPDAEGWVLSIAINLLNDRRLDALCEAARRPGGRPRSLALAAESAECGRMRWLLADIAAVLTHDRASALPDSVTARIALLISLVDELFAERGRDAPSPRPQSPRARLADRFVAMVDHDFRSGRSIADYARELGATSPTLTRSCREVHGKTPGALILDRILLEAMRSLTYSGATVTQIALDLGFAEPAYFARFFKQRTGMTASAFRNQRAWLGMGG